MKDTRIFRYVLEDAWGRMISQLDVIKTDEAGEARGLYFDRRSSENGDTVADSQRILLSSSDTEQIINIIEDHKEISEYRSLEFPHVLDGFINRFEFTINENIHVISGFNVWAFLDNRYLQIEGNPPTKGRNILDIFSSIITILEKNGMKREYLQLKEEQLS